jgi:hypothetical protein
MVGKPTSEENLARYDQIAVALAKFSAALEWTTSIIERWQPDAAGLAVVATMEFMQNVGLSRRYLAPLGEALDIIAKMVPTEREPHFRRGVAMLRDYDKFISNPRPLGDFRGEGNTWKDTTKIIAVIAVDFQRLCKVPLPEALKRVVGHDPRAAKRLEDFRDILRRTKPSIKRGSERNRNRKRAIVLRATHKYSEAPVR